MSTPHTNHILAAMMRSSEDDRIDGLSWYDRALDFATELSPANPAIGAGVISALSPRLAWPLNVKRAREVFDTGTTSGLSQSVKKAERILNGEAPLDVLGGDKTTAFFHNIMGDWEGFVTIDRHAIDIAHGEPCDDVTRVNALRKNGYAILSEMYRDAAFVVGIAPAQLQAVTWTYWRRSVTSAFFGDV